MHASRNVSRITVCMSSFRHHVKKNFSHRVDAIAVVNKVEQTLCDQHGGMRPADFLHKVNNDKFGDLSSPDERRAVEKLCLRWMNRDEISREFSVFYPFDRKRCFRWDLLTEERISEIKRFLEEWLEDPKTHAHFN